ncbi:MAG TPA: hypothetical protein VL997_13595 [Dyella sp.]|nr:hypothetical protein [Dyella sp.]
MKIFSTATMAALLLGTGAIMHSANVKAQIDGCQQLAIECDEGDQEACHLYQVGGCKGEAPTGSILKGTPSAKTNHTPDTASLNSKPNVTVAK